MADRHQGWLSAPRGSKANQAGVVQELLMSWWWPFGHLVVVQLLCHIFLVKQQTPSQGRCLLKLPGTVNQELLQSTSSQNQQIIYREPGSAPKEPETKESHPCAPS